MAKKQVVVPDIGGAEGAEVIEVLVAEGDSIEQEQGLIVLESDKASMEIPSTEAGTLVELLVKEGDELSEGSPIAVIETAADEADDSAPEGSAESEASTESEQSEPEQSEPEQSEPEQSEKEESQSEPEPESGSEPEAAEDAAPEGGEEQEIRIPDIGTDEAVELIEISVKVGDTVAEGDTLVVLESDKASMEVPAEQAGEVVELLVEEGQQVKTNDPLLRLKTSAAAAPAEKESAPAKKEAAPAEKTPPAKPAEPSKPQPAAATAASGAADSSEAARTANSPAPKAGIYAGPAVRKLAREFGVDLEKVKGTGPRGRLLKEDIQSYVKTALEKGPASAGGGLGIPAVPEIDFSEFGEVEKVSRSGLEKTIASNMHRSWLNVPHVTQWDDVDITELEEFRKSLKAEADRRGTRITPMPFLIKAVAAALAENPKFNASLADGGESLVFKKYIHIGMAVDTPAGLLVPVIRDVDSKSIWQISEEVLDLAGRARDRKLKPAEMKGGCFTISSLGNIGGRGFTPIVNTPEVGILGVSRAGMQPVWDGQAFQPRTMLPVALSYDHRVINGGDAGRFMSSLIKMLTDIRQILM